MKITKFEQSCLVIEKDDKRILIDPGSLSAERNPADFGRIDAVVLTHRHGDHVDAELIKKIIGQNQTPVIANADTKEAFGDLVTEVISDQQTIEAAGFSVTAQDLPHCPMVDGSAGPPNTGFLFDEFFFHSGDGIKLDNFQAKAAAVPIAGPDISLRDAYEFIQSLGAKQVIPVHYTIFSDAKPSLVAGMLQNKCHNATVTALASGQSLLL